MTDVVGLVVLLAEFVRDRELLAILEVCRTLREYTLGRALDVRGEYALAVRLVELYAESRSGEAEDTYDDMHAR